MNPTHYHTTKIIAENCIKDQTRRKEAPKNQRKTRNFYILQETLKGQSITNIAKEVALSRAYTYILIERLFRQLYYRGNRKYPYWPISEVIKNANYWLDVIHKDYQKGGD